MSQRARRGMTALEERAQWHAHDRFNDALKKHDHVTPIEIGCYKLGLQPLQVQDMLWSRGWRGSIERPKTGLFDLIGQALVSLIKTIVGSSGSSGDIPSVPCVTSPTSKTAQARVPMLPKPLSKPNSPTMPATFPEGRGECHKAPFRVRLMSLIKEIWFTA
jgi:hypothetical protein